MHADSLSVIRAAQRVSSITHNPERWLKMSQQEINTLAHTGFIFSSIRGKAHFRESLRSRIKRHNNLYHRALIGYIYIFKHY